MKYVINWRRNKNGQLGRKLLFILFFKYLNFGDISSGSQKLQEDETGVRGHAGCSCVTTSSNVKWDQLIPSYCQKQIWVWKINGK